MGYGFYRIGTMTHVVPLFYFFKNDRSMKKNKQKKMVTITILEGIWGSGKTTLARALKTKYHARILKEPHHVRAGVKTGNAHSLTSWYLSAHKKNMENGAILARRGRAVVVERSPLSSIAFAKVFLKKDMRAAFFDFKRTTEDLRAKGINIRIIYLPPAEIKSTLLRMRRSIYLKKFADADSIQMLNAYLLKKLCILKRKKILELVIQSRRNSISKLPASQ